jgi:class 3 adenylate cyclase
MITKIKLIGDIYMAAGGLFHPNEEPQKHASQIVQFGLECIQAVEEVNDLLNIHLQVRVGVNSDGPLIAGVLGTDKPVFDIIGDTINVAARLQSTGIPGNVQISETTYDLLKEMEFIIEYRGEVALKGKGNRKAYLVKVFQPTLSFF